MRHAKKQESVIPGWLVSGEEASNRHCLMGPRCLNLVDKDFKAALIKLRTKGNHFLFDTFFGVTQSHSVAQAGVQWYDFGSLQPLPPGFNKAILPPQPPE